MVFSFFNDSSWILETSQGKLKTMLQPGSESCLSSKQKKKPLERAVDNANAKCFGGWGQTKCIGGDLKIANRLISIY